MAHQQIEAYEMLAGLLIAESGVDQFTDEHGVINLKQFRLHVSAIEQTKLEVAFALSALIEAIKERQYASSLSRVHLH